MSEKKKFLLRIDGRLYDALEKWAADDFRSVNAQMEYILAEAVRRSGRLSVRGAGGDGGERPTEQDASPRGG